MQAGAGERPDREGADAACLSPFAEKGRKGRQSWVKQVISLASQLSVVTGETDYNVLEKCYSIWICRDNIPQREHYSISYYDIRNSRNLGGCQPKEEDYDLLSMVIVRLGHAECPEGEGVLSDGEIVDLMGFVNTIITHITNGNSNEERTQEVQ